MFKAAALQDIVKAGGVPYRTNALSFIFDCPLCGKANKLWMYRETGFFKCWVCATERGFAGRAEKALVQLYGGDLKDYERILRSGEADTLGILDIDLFRDEEDDDIVDDREPVFYGWEWSPASCDREDPRFERARAYLAGRGIGEDIISKYDIHFTPGENRVLFPYTLGPELVGWQGRLCGSNQVVDSLTGKTREIPKALTKLQDGIQSNYVMCSQNLARSPHAVVAEGPISCYKLELCGGNVATLGKGVSPAQLRWLAAKVRRIYLALDVDAVQDIERIAQFLVGMDTEVFVMSVPDHVSRRVRDRNPDAEADFGDCTPEEAFQAFQDAHEWTPGQLIINVGGKLYY